MSTYTGSAKRLLGPALPKQGDAQAAKEATKSWIKAHTAAPQPRSS